MEHLKLEALARLVDEAPSDAEDSHLAGCVRCRTELDLLRGQTRALGELPDMRPPRGDWAMLEARLMSEGLVRHERSRLASTPGWMRAAAAILLFVGGAGVGSLVGGGGPATVGGPGNGDSPYSLTASTVSTVEEAEEAVRLAERRYMDALVQYRQLSDTQDGQAGSGSTESRLAALEYLVAAGQAAVQQAPTDPFLNGFLASAVAERRATYESAMASSESADDWY